MPVVDGVPYSVLFLGLLVWFHDLCYLYACCCWCLACSVPVVGGVPYSVLDNVQRLTLVVYLSIRYLYANC